MPGNIGVYVGVNKSAPYGLYVEKGTSNQEAQPYLEPGVTNAIPKIAKIANQIYASRMGGK
jgi:HK97 gp10 family phage protein